MLERGLQKVIEILSSRFSLAVVLGYLAGACCIFAVVDILIRLTDRKHHVTTVRRIGAAGLPSYYFLTYAYTVLARASGSDSRITLEFFWSYKDILNTHSGTEVFFNLINLAMLAPVGFMLPMAFGKRMRWWKVLLIGAGCSYFIELSQLLLHRGNFELFDDPINNVLGCMIGYGVYCLIKKIK